MTHAREPFDGLPERVGPYRRLRQLGAGGMGAVFEVEHEETGARYALKVILPEALGVEGLARFRQEAEAMARLDHRHLAKIHTARLEPPLFFLVLDLYPGGTLEARLADGPLPVAEATSIAARVADGVAHAHAHGVIAIGSAVLLTAMVARFALQSLARRVAQRRLARGMRRGPSLEPRHIELVVEGMTCGGCANRLQKSLARLEGVEAAQVDFERKRAVVDGGLSEAQVRQAIRAAGFEA